MYSLLYLVPKNLLSYLVGILVEIKWPHYLNSPLKKWFVKRYQIDMSEATYALESYETIGQLFVRQLKTGKRPIGKGFVHPCDALLTQGGAILHDQLIQAKGKSYSLKKLLADHPQWEKFSGGHYLTYYLCPTDYHRVHSPVTGKIISCTHVPGRLWPVNPWSVENITDLFAVNERTITLIESTEGCIAYIMVGATNVGKMTMSFDSEIVTNQSHFSKLRTKKYQPALPIDKGAELGVFNMGSTVIVLTTPKYFKGLWPSGYQQKVKMGESLKLKEL